MSYITKTPMLSETAYWENSAGWRAYRFLLPRGLKNWINRLLKTSGHQSVTDLMFCMELALRHGA